MTSNAELTCKEVVELVTGYLEHALLPGMHKRFEEHLAECPGCETYLEQVQLTISMLHRLAAEPVFPATKQELLQTFRNWKQGAGIEDPENKGN